MIGFSFLNVNSTAICLTNRNHYGLELDFYGSIMVSKHLNKNVNIIKAFSLFFVSSKHLYKSIFQPPGYRQVT